MTAAELLDYDRTNLVGLVLERATAASHVTIVARALGIALVRVRDIVSRSENGDMIIVDGDEGSVHVRPVEDLRASYRERVDFRAERVAYYDELRDLPAATKDGTEVKLLLNAGLTVDLPQLDQTGAEGIGLFRTELQFMVSSALPRLGEQLKFYRSVLDAAGDKPVTFRTLDVGGDKVLPYLRSVEEDNPALGLRAIRLSIERPGLLRVQLRALLKAAVGKTLRIKLPMVTNVSEVDEVRAVLDREIAAQAQFGHELPREILLGSMIEVPSLLWQMDELCQRVDFISVGTNDLFQYMTASDRTNTFLANRYNPISRPFLRALREIVKKADEHNTQLYLCGELGSEPLSVLALLGIGYRAVSMPPGSIGPVKEMVRSVKLDHAAAVINEALDDRQPAQTMMELLQDYADQHGVPV